MFYLSLSNCSTKIQNQLFFWSSLLILQTYEAIKKLVENQKKGVKLTETKVRLIKKRVLNPNRRTRIKIIARQFGVSEMAIYRIKSGENWGWVK